MSTRFADFNAANDTIQPDRSVFTAITTLGTLAAAAFFAGAAAHDADDRIIFNSATGNLFYDRDGIGDVAAVQFARLAAHLPSATSTSTWSPERRQPLTQSLRRRMDKLPPAQATSGVMNEVPARQSADSGPSGVSAR